MAANKTTDYNPVHLKMAAKTQIVVLQLQERQQQSPIFIQYTVSTNHQQVIYDIITYFLCQSQQWAYLKSRII